MRIYLSLNWFNNFANTRKRQGRYGKALGEVFKREEEIKNGKGPTAGKMSAEKYALKEEARLLKKFKLNEDGMDVEELQKSISFKSTKYPKNNFEVGFMEFVETPEGFGEFFGDRCIDAVSDIFIDEGDDEEFISPNWEESLKRATTVLNELNKFIKKTAGLPVKASQNIFSGTEVNIASEDDPFGLYGDLNLYRDALEMAVETCEHVLSQDDPDNFYLSWTE